MQMVGHEDNRPQCPRLLRFHTKQFLLAAVDHLLPIKGRGWPDQAKGEKIVGTGR
jgi:hypothetical protein